MRWVVWWLWMVAGLGVLISAPGCTRGVDEARLHQDTQERLDQGVKPGC